MDYPLIPQKELFSRVSRLQSELRNLGIDAAVFSYRALCLYFAGSSQLMTLVVPADDEPALFVKRAVERAREESPWRDIRPLKSSSQVFDFLKGFKKIGMPFSRISASQLIFYRERLGAEILDISGTVEEMKAVKSEFEIECIKKAAEIAERVFIEACNYIKEGMSEIEVGGIFDMLGRRYGSEGLLRTGDISYEAYTWHVVSGKNAFHRSYIETVVGGRGLSPSFPCGAGRKRIKRGEPFMVDFGATYLGYSVDHARMYVIGEPPDGFTDFYERIKKLQKAVEKLCTPGALCSEIYEASHRIADGLGIKKVYLGGEKNEVNFLAHGIGLELSDKPIIGRGQNYPLKENMTFSMEPKLLIPDMGPCGTEDVYVVKEEGALRLTTTPDELFVI